MGHQISFIHYVKTVPFTFLKTRVGKNSSTDSLFRGEIKIKKNSSTDQRNKVVKFYILFRTNQLSPLMVLMVHTLQHFSPPWNGYLCGPHACIVKPSTRYVWKKKLILNEASCEISVPFPRLALALLLIWNRVRWRDHLNTRNTFQVLIDAMGTWGPKWSGHIYCRVVGY